LEYLYWRIENGVRQAILLEERVGNKKIYMRSMKCAKAESTLRKIEFQSDVNAESDEMLK
jgi:hypothetical protein